MCVGIHGTRVEVRGQHAATDFLCPLYGSQGLNSDHQACQQMPLRTQPRHWQVLLFKIHREDLLGEGSLFDLRGQWNCTVSLGYFTVQCDCDTDSSYQGSGSLVPEGSLRQSSIGVQPKNQS